MQIYGYHRTSTKEQHLDRGIQEIERYCNEHEMALTNIFTDQETGKNFNRPRYNVLVEDVLRLGDILIVTGALCFYGAGRAGEKGEATAGRYRSEEIAG